MSIDNVFPFLEDTGAQKKDVLPLFKEWDYDFAKCEVRRVDGRNVLLSGRDALKVWCYKALKTEERRYKAYTTGFGNTLHKFIGQRYSAAYTQARTNEYVRAALLKSEYINAVECEVAMVNGVLEISADVKSVYGAITVESEVSL